MPTVQRDPVVGHVIGAAVDVHHLLGPGLLESAYASCLAYELIQRGMRVERQVPVPVRYKDVALDCGFRLDLLVNRDVIVEVKSVDRLAPIHTAQVLTYLRLTGARRALLLNFNAVTLKAGLRSSLRGGTIVPDDGDEGSDRSP